MRPETAGAIKRPKNNAVLPYHFGPLGQGQGV